MKTRHSLWILLLSVGILSSSSTVASEPGVFARCSHFLRTKFKKWTPPTILSVVNQDHSWKRRDLPPEGFVSKGSDPASVSEPKTKRPIDRSRLFRGSDTKRRTAGSRLDRQK